jgi:2-polyprenyl-3-methyl-5-hydroxy-6-metoxy-1,4-benzoquinol methylase
VNREELEQRIAEFSQWNYRFEFDNGVTTPLPDPRRINRQEQRRRYIFDALIHLFGGSLGGRRVLDLGCSAGFWSLQATEAGADYVLGVDAEPTYIDQANLIFEAKGVDPARYRFEQGNVFAHHLSGHFDVVLCLGLLDQVSKPVELFELMAGLEPEIIVIETELARAASGVFEVASLGRRQNIVDHKIALIPSREAVAELASEFGYETAPLARNITDYSGMTDYRSHRRLAFFCSKGRSLEELATEGSSVTPRWLSPLQARLRRLIG